MGDPISPRILKMLCLHGLLMCMLATYLGTGCWTPSLRKSAEVRKTWTCDKEADEAIVRNDYHAGIVLHQRLLKREPENTLALYHLGYAYGQIGELESEVFYYEKAAALGFKEDRLFFNLGMAYGELHQTEKSVLAFKEALKINPKSAESHYGLAMAYQSSGADKLVEQELLEAIRVEPEHVEARLLLSMLYVDWGELHEAVEQLRKILEIDPGNETAQGLLERIKSE